MKKFLVVILILFVVAAISYFALVDRFGNPTAECAHTYDNSCDTTCNTCGVERATAHVFADATCTAPKTCLCGATEGEAKGHSLFDATCAEAAGCENCDAKFGEANLDNHDFASVDEDGKCLCGQYFVARVGNVFFATFSEALEAWVDGTTMTLLTDVEYNDAEVEVLNKSVIFDLNGKNITTTLSRLFIVGSIKIEDVDDERVMILTPGELTIRDSGENGSITSKNTAITVQDKMTLEGGTLNNPVSIGDMAIFNMTGGRIIGNGSNGLVQAIMPSGTVNISGGTLYGRYGISALSGAVINISGNPTIIGNDLNERNSGAAIQVLKNVTINISGTPTLIGGSAGELFLNSCATLSCQPAEGKWRVRLANAVLFDNGGVFAVPGEGVEFDVSKFESMLEGYEIVKLEDGSLAFAEVE